MHTHAPPLVVPDIHGPRSTIADGGRPPGHFPDAALITGVVCGVRVEEVEDPLMQKIRYLDKLVDELARGKAMEKVLRSS